MKAWTKIFILFFGSFLGGMTMTFLLSPQFSLAQELKFLQANRFQLVDAKGQARGEGYVPENSGGIFNLYGFDGKMRVQLGSYSGDYAAAEKGQPMAGLYDNHADLRLLLRLAGKNESPVLVMKDKQHRDRIVMGLGLNDPGEEPFLAYFDNAGNKHMVMGSY